MPHFVTDIRPVDSARRATSPRELRLAMATSRTE
jgi:hypothetical protein